ncbi:MAG: HsdM family class I SAM-dependent methyltransferase [Brevibacterium linens]|uniref:HsdM family class I SAM-dependent methyltransferase n=1 Tax=Brevibacterium linens TaxID=1703 RepID=UPI003F962193
MSTPITATTIAAIAGVTVTAVGQWRHRDESFPKPLDPTVRPVTFDQDAVIDWLTATGRTVTLPDTPDTPTGESPTEHERVEITLRTIIDRLRSVISRDQFSTTLTLFAAQRHIDDTSVDNTTVPEPLAGTLAELFTDTALQEAYELTAGITATEILDYLDARGNSSKTDAMYGSPQVVNNLLAHLAPDDCHSIIDIACGTGGTLDALHHRFPEATFCGNDIDDSVLVTAQTRALIAGWDATWSQHNALAPDVFPAGTFDLVCSVPPWGIRSDKKTLTSDPQRWPYGVPLRTDDTAWLQLAHHLLTDNGTAIIVLPATILPKRATQAILRDMTSDYSLQAVIDLPRHLHYGTSAPTVALIITKNPTTTTDTVLFARIDDNHVTRDRSRRITAVDTGPLVDALTTYRAGKHVESTALFTQVGRLDLLRTDSTYKPAYWITRATTSTPGELQQDLATAVGKITPLDGVGGLIDSLDINPGKVKMTTAKNLPSVQIRHSHFNSGRDDALRVGDICIDRNQARVCTTDGEKPTTGGYLQVVRCDATQIDPWFLAAVITAALTSGSTTDRTVLPRVDLSLVDVPVLGIDEQRGLGAVYRDTINKQALVEQQAHAWGQLSGQVATSIASGLASVRDPLRD